MNSEGYVFEKEQLDKLSEKQFKETGPWFGIPKSKESKLQNMGRHERKKWLAKNKKKLKRLTRKEGQ